MDILTELFEKLIGSIDVKSIETTASFILGLHFQKDHRSILQFNRPETMAALMQPHT